MMIWIESDEFSARWSDVPEELADLFFNHAEVLLGRCDTLT